MWSICYLWSVESIFFLCFQLQIKRIPRPLLFKKCYRLLPLAHCLIQGFKEFPEKISASVYLQGRHLKTHLYICSIYTPKSQFRKLWSWMRSTRLILMSKLNRPVYGRKKKVLSWVPAYPNVPVQFPRPVHHSSEQRATVSPIQGSSNFPSERPLRWTSGLSG